MEITELFLLTAFSCMACDGEIATEEIDLLKSFATSENLFSTIDVEGKLKKYVERINDEGICFLKDYLNILSDAKLTSSEQLQVVDIAIKMIEADNVIQYSEIAFFKKIRTRLSISDTEILERWPDKEDYLLPDTKTKDVKIDWNNINFEVIKFDDMSSLKQQI